MARSSPLRFRQRSGVSRRLGSWELGPSGQVAGVVTSSNNVFSVSGQASQDKLTLVRTRGELIVAISTAGGAALEGFEWAFGMCVVNENAGGVGVTAIPDPITDIGWDGWFVYETGTVLTMGSTREGLGILGAEFTRIPIDSKAMRKLKISDVIVGVLATTEKGDGSTLMAQLQSRIFVKLP